MARAFDAIILDMDGVVTDTAALHAEAWKKTFDGYLQERAGKAFSSFMPFDLQTDYRTYVDGKLRSDGIRSFLVSRGVVLSDEEVFRLGEKKNQIYLSRLSERGPGVYEDAVKAIRKWKRSRLRIGLISSSKNARAVLQAGGIA